jgi:hypothetical protein
MISQRCLYLRRFRFLTGSRMLLLKVSAKLLSVITIRLIPNLHPIDRLAASGLLPLVRNQYGNG